mmetsp:Transcript_35880/g.70506  ORF Transcript_35880/g.70506 Transcript_35880/m.70506 type:complete len:118 (-) Transcript_35880:8-361(-)
MGGRGEVGGGVRESSLLPLAPLDMGEVGKDEERSLGLGVLTDNDKDGGSRSPSRAKSLLPAAAAAAAVARELDRQDSKREPVHILLQQLLVRGSPTAQALQVGWAHLLDHADLCLQH